MKPIQPDDQMGSSTWDHAKDGFSLSALENLVRDCDGQPDWRPRADTAHAYYDFKQLTAEQKRKIWVEQGIEPRQTNLVHGVINGVLGQEAKARSDVKIEADDDSLVDVCDVLTKAMKEAQREANTDMAISNGYAGQVKGGIGWVEVSRSGDPLDYPYRVEDRHRNEIWYDWRARDLGLKDARWMIRKRWEDLDEAEAMMPEFKHILSQSLNGWDLMNLPDDVNSYLYRSYNNERRTSIRRDEWCDSTRKRIKFFEVWYRVPAEVVVMHMGPTRRIVYDENNPLHQAAVSRNKVRLSKAITRQIRMALFAGPHRLLDVATTRRAFPYVPFFAFRDDEDRSPYGLIEGMISPQDEYNERRQRINWMLRARQLSIDNDALDQEYNTIADVTDSAGRPDMVTILNANRKNANGLTIRNDLSLQKEQIDVMQDAKQLIQEVPRIYSTQLGSAPSGVTSGVAINSLTEAGTVAMGELNDNYRFARKAVHEQILELIVEDHLERELRVQIGQGSTRRVVVLNSWNPQTQEPVNHVKDAPIKVGLSDVPSSPAYRMQEQQQLATMVQALAGNQQALAILTPAYIEGSSIANRQQIADDLRRATGQATVGDRQAQQVNEAQNKQTQAAAQELQQRDAVATVATKEAKAAEIAARTQLVLTKVGQSNVSEQPPAANEDQLIQQALQEAAA
jgi:hypothetical protein